MVLKKIKSRMSAKKKKKTASSPKISEEQLFELIQDRAYKLWENDNRPYNNDWNYWFRAESQIREKFSKISKI